eukprot:s2243_g4.t1
MAFPESDMCSSDTWEEMSDVSETEERPAEISAESKAQRNASLGKTSSAKTHETAAHTHVHRHQHFRSIVITGKRVNKTIPNRCVFKVKAHMHHHVHLEVLHAHHIMDEQGLHHIRAQDGTAWMKLDAITSSSSSSSATGPSSQHGASQLHRGRAYEDLGEIESTGNDAQTDQMNRQPFGTAAPDQTGKQPNLAAAEEPGHEGKQPNLAAAEEPGHEGKQPNLAAAEEPGHEGKQPNLAAAEDPGHEDSWAISPAYGSY